VRVLVGSGVSQIHKDESTGEWIVDISDGTSLRGQAVLITAGSSPQMWDMIARLGHHIVPPVPSLFTFNCTDPRIEGLAGLVAPHADVCIGGTRFEESGPVLITHWGLSGPGILKLSARAARELAECGYDFEIEINWDSGLSPEELFEQLKDIRMTHPRRQVSAFSPTRLPQRLWESLIAPVINPESRWADLSNATLQLMCRAVFECRFSVRGKSTFKEEFVTAGGVDLREIDFTSMESRMHKNLFFAGEVLNIDAVTGGFNFQAAWTTGWIAGTAAAAPNGPHGP
jgi:predicted Rossmann fold flavoprotein